MGCSTQKRNPQYWYMITSLADLTHYQVLVIAVFILNLTNLNKITFMSLKSQHTIILIELFFLNQPSKYDSKYVWIFANLNLIRCWIQMYMVVNIPLIITKCICTSKVTLLPLVVLIQIREYVQFISN